MTEEEKYAFDVCGYLVVENAIPANTLVQMNAWIDEQERKDPHWLQHSPSILHWGPPFLALLDNPRVLPYLIELLGPELRLDHDYPIFSKAGAPPLELHGGGTPYDPAQYYHCYRGQMYSGLTVASYALADIPPGAGGFCCIPGSHKANFPCPTEIKLFQKESRLVQQVPMNAGDCILFTEALTHGTLPWKASHQRRNLFLKYSPKHLSWANKYYLSAPTHAGIERLEPYLTPTQRALLAPPSVYQHPRVN